MAKPIVYKVTASNGSTLVECGDGYTQQGSDAGLLMALLLEPGHDVVQFFWDIDRSLAPIFAYMGEDICRKLVKETRAYYRPCSSSLFYIPGKIFGIKQGRLRGEFYDLAQYFPDEKPQTVGEMQNLAEMLFEAVRELGIEPARWTSPARMMKDCVLKDLDLPNGLDQNIVPDEVGEMAWLCAGKLWTEAFELGHFKSVYDYDITAAYPSEVCKMLDPRCLKWEKSEDDPPKEALYGYVDARVKIDAPVHPVIRRDDDGCLSSPVGEWNDVIPLSLMRFIEYWKLGQVRVNKAWYGIPTGWDYPMAETMKSMYAVRQTVSPLAAGIIKRMMASFYGLTLQSNDDGTFGEYFQPIWGAEICTRISLRVADFCYRNNIKPIHIGVDGVMCQQEMKLQEDTGMGYWRLSSTEPAIIMGSGMLYQGDKHPANLYYDEVLELLKAKPNAGEYEKRVEQVCTLQQGLATSFGNVGKLMDMSSHLLVKAPKDRVYNPAPKCGRDILEYHWSSKPVKVHEEDMV
jgi:hypothetical protein